MERFHGLPDRQIDNDARVLERANGRRVTFVALQPPDESGAPVSQRVDGGQLRDEALHLKRIQRRNHARDVDLGEVVVP